MMVMMMMMMMMMTTTTTKYLDVTTGHEPLKNDFTLHGPWFEKT
jgi:hypothetical protein